MPNYKKEKNEIDLNWYDKKNKDFLDIINGYKKIQQRRGFSEQQRNEIFQIIHPEKNLIDSYLKNTTRQSFLNCLIDRIKQKK